MTGGERAFPFPETWDRAGLEKLGFTGFVPFSRVREPRSMRLPSESGLYVVLRPNELAPAFLGESTAKGAAYPIDDLAARRFSGPIVYIGKTDGARGLHHRVKQYARRGNSHAGGRSIWQLSDADELLVGWVVTPGELGDVEARWITRFVVEFGHRPFANIDD